jgi:hypothetical protein
MEVHAHTHTARKKWTHYFWEFLMLFLAVFCGFLAEYQLEHMIEKTRERQFLRSLVNDVKADIDHLDNIINNRNSRQIRLDSLTLLLNSPEYEKMGNSIYYYAIHVARRIDIRFTPNNGTMQQLKNAGGLRLIRNRAVVDSIVKYDVSTRNLEKLGETEEIVLQDYRVTAAKIFNPIVLEKMVDEENNASRPTDNPALFSYDKNLLNELRFKLHTSKLINKGSKRDVKKLLQQAVNLLNTLKNEYQLK